MGGPPVGPRPSAVDQLLRTSFATEQSIYGVILVSGMIVVAGTHGETSWSVFTTVVFTVVVFWAAHVYAGTVAHHALSDEHTALPDAFRQSVKHSLGLLASAIVPSLVLLLGATRRVDDQTAIWAALWVGVIVLAVLGYTAYARRGARLPARLLGAAGTSAFGIAMILLKALVH